MNLKTIADELALLNQPVLEDDLILHIVKGLSRAPKDISTAIRTRNDFISFTYLHEQLVEHESYLKQIDSQSENQVVTAHLANKSLSKPKYFRQKLLQTKSSPP
ncbi:hypothetical protein FEM48_Zijuj08G0203100 [Ziziphus jujuba var. spinosa]|uniref:Uncharacterized protein n=1 Tax=Ziziphus jujuba var. spinosa TaxID=714518 RepID=A0A978V164_ZIZJJ|nr:hypothetical protein FEM48_Zijuj08G0203100 [Ziziphus jujuba var. spinosa]